ncbi:MAG: hypothetical protein ACKVQC_08400 [Elusimicrobiota bacterium]
MDERGRGAEWMAKIVSALISSDPAAMTRVKPLGIGTMGKVTDEDAVLSAQINSWMTDPVFQQQVATLIREKLQKKNDNDSRPHLFLARDISQSNKEKSIGLIALIKGVIQSGRERNVIVVINNSNEAKIRSVFSTFIRLGILGDNIHVKIDDELLDREKIEQEELLKKFNAPSRIVMPRQMMDKEPSANMEAMEDLIDSVRSLNLDTMERLLRVVLVAA